MEQYQENIDTNIWRPEQFVIHEKLKANRMF